MQFDRRGFLQAGAAFTFAAAVPRLASAQVTFAPQPGAWRSFLTVTRLEIVNPAGETQAWIPLPSVNEEDWFRSNGNQWSTNGKATLARDPKYGAEMLHVEWTEDERAPVIEV